MLNLLRRISCFMSSPEKPYVVDNSALTGREAASVSRIPGRAVWVHLAHPIWVSRAASGLIAVKVIVPPQLVHPALPQARGKGSGAHLVGPCAGLWVQAASDSPGSREVSGPEPVDKSH